MLRRSFSTIKYLGQANIYFSIQGQMHYVSCHMIIFRLFSITNKVQNLLKYQQRCSLFHWSGTEFLTIDSSPQTVQYKIYKHSHCYYKFLLTYPFSSLFNTPCCPYALILHLCNFYWHGSLILIQYNFFLYSAIHNTVVPRRFTWMCCDTFQHH